MWVASNGLEKKTRRPFCYMPVWGGVSGHLGDTMAETLATPLAFCMDFSLAWGGSSPELWGGTFVFQVEWRLRPYWVIPVRRLRTHPSSPHLHTCWCGAELSQRFGAELCSCLKGRYFGPPGRSLRPGQISTMRANHNHVMQCLWR